MKIKQLLAYFCIFYLSVLATTNEELKSSFSAFSAGLFLFDMLVLFSTLYLLYVVRSYFELQGISKKESLIYAFLSLFLCFFFIYLVRR